jgi:hypothetical protein
MEVKKRGRKKIDSTEADKVNNSKKKRGRKPKQS